jgi:hydrogenase nickel incorporation protein HypA/HybF
VHELGIAASLLEQAQRERAGGRLVRVGVRVGALAGVDPDALRFGFEVLSRDADPRGVLLEIEQVAHRRRCETCGDFESPRLLAACPRCGSTRTTLLAGDELVLSWVEVDEP